MPELPEIETIVAALRRGSEEVPSLIDLNIVGTQLLWERSLKTPTPAEFQRRIIGQTIRDIHRRGKYLLFYLSLDTLLIHLGMSGDLLMEPDSTSLAVHHRLILNLQNGWRLAFNDTRKFGRVWLTTEPKTVLSHLGPEPLEVSFTSQDLYQRLQTRHRKLKPLLLDQSFLAGLGNIYTDEALHMAHLHPLTTSNTLTLSQAECLWQSIRGVLQEGIRRNGASIDWVYKGGEYQHYFRVYGRTGQPCSECGSLIQRIVVGQRGTHYCPVCQPPPVDSME